MASEMMEGIERIIVNEPNQETAARDILNVIADELKKHAYEDHQPGTGEIVLDVADWLRTQAEGASDE